MKWLQCLLFLGLVCAIGFLAWTFWPWPGINPRNFNRIHLGMSDVQVYAILGGPPRDEPGHDDGLDFSPTIAPRWEIWRGRDFGIAVYFSKDDKVVDKTGIWGAKYLSRPEPLHQKWLRDWLGIHVGVQKVRE